MPHAADKIIINSNGSRGMARAIQAEFDSLKMLGDEIVGNHWAPETVQFRDELQKACDAHHQADMEYYSFLRDLVRKLAAFIDDHPGP